MAPRKHAHADQANDGDDAMFDTSPAAMKRAQNGRLKSFIERLERLQQEKDEIAEGMKEVFAEMKGDGFDTKVTRAVLKIRKQDRAKRLEFEAILDLYLAELGEI